MRQPEYGICANIIDGKSSSVCARLLNEGPELMGTVLDQMDTENTQTCCLDRAKKKIYRCIDRHDGVGRRGLFP